MEHPPYFPDLAPNNFWLFPKIKSVLKGWKNKKGVTIATKAIPQQKLQKCSQQWQHHWAKCTATQVEYFEGDSS
jgi:hypothetical protein